VSGVIAINGRELGPNEVVFIPRGAAYNARVMDGEGARVLRVELPGGARDIGDAEYDARVWRGPLTDDGIPHLPTVARKPTEEPT
jgi:hypothetical protein